MVMADSGTDTNAPGDAARGDAAAAGNAPGRRRQRVQEQPEIVDPLTEETRRKSLLDAIERQLKDVEHVSRLLFAFGVSDDRKIQSSVDQEFVDWLQKQGYADKISGIRIYIGQAAVELLEGPTELLFKALEFINTLSVEVSEKDGNASNEGASRSALISAIRVLHFTELHGTRAATSWCAYAHQSKLVGSNTSQLEESNSAELVFIVYNKLLQVCLKVSEQVDAAVKRESLQDQYRRQAESLPTADDTLILLSKSGTDFFFSFAEFEKVFMKPFHCVLHSELLWPMPPALSYLGSSRVA